MNNISQDIRRLMANFFSLSVLQGLNMILPLITLPYLVRVLGVETFGLLSFSLSIIMYFNILVSFGFELSATRQVSLNREDKIKVSQIFFSVMAIKVFLLFMSLIVIYILAIFVPSIENHFSLYLATFGLVVGNMLFPSWLFQGMEQMKYITIINVISRTIATCFIFVFITSEADYIYFPIINSIAAIIAGLSSLHLIFKLFNIAWVIPSREMIKNQFFESYHFFISRIANNGSRYYATTIIGVTFGNVLLGYYSIVEKLFYALMSVSGVVSQTIFPYMSRTKNIVFFKKVLLVTTIVSIISSLLLMYYNELFLSLLFDMNNKTLSQIFIVVFSGAIFGSISTMVGYPLLAAFGFVKYANNSLIYASIVFVSYISIAVNLGASIYVVSFSVSLYAMTGLAFRLYFINKYLKNGVTNE